MNNDERFKSYVAFRETWNAAESLAAAASQLGLTPRQASAKAHYLRRWVKLKRFDPGAKKQSTKGAKS